MQTGYTVWAYSPSTNEWQRQMNLHDLRPITEEATAIQWAESHAMTCRRMGTNGATDWQPKIKLENLGIETMDHYLSHTNT